MGAQRKSLIKDFVDFPDHQVIIEEQSEGMVSNQMGTASHTLTSGDGLSHQHYLGKIMKPDIIGSDTVNRDLHDCIHEMRNYLNEIDQKYVDGDHD